MKTAYFYLTENGLKIAEKLKGTYDGEIFGKENFRNSVGEAFKSCELLVFVTATGIAVRTIADLIQSKLSDPAVLVIDQKGSFVISLISGHLGGGNFYARQFAKTLSAIPVITTATDTENIFAVDEFARQNDIAIENPENIKLISSALLRGEHIDFVTTFKVNGISDSNINFTENFRNNNSVVLDTGFKAEETERIVLYLRPRILCLGIGCRKNIEYGNLKESFLDFMAKNNQSILSLKCIATIGLKKNEPAINRLCEEYKLPLEIVGNEKIEVVESRFEFSDYVKKVTGVGSVAEASAFVASGMGKTICGKTRYNGITFSLAQSNRDFTYTGE